MNKTIVQTYGQPLIPELLELLKKFCEESTMLVTFNEVHSRVSLQSRLVDDECFTAVELVDGIPAGFVMCLLDQSWHDEKFGYIEKFYVAPSYRGTTTGRNLIDAATLWFDVKDVSRSFLTDTAGVHTDRRLINMVAKFGYTECGATLMRKLHGQV